MTNIYANLFIKQSRKDLKLAVMRQMIKPKAKDNVLDIGCADNTFLQLIKKSQANLYGVDACTKAVKICLNKGLNVKKVYLQDNRKFPYKSNFFSYIIAGEIIEHIYDTDFFLKEIFSLLKKNGLLIISTPNLASLGRRLLLLLGKNPVIETGLIKNQTVGHIRYFVKSTLFVLLKRQGFKILEYKSDVVNFVPSGKIKSRLFAQLMPGLGRSIIVKCQK
jgi:2-polyprenyl-3-methyl-5-hydroxy-6-metoxy-1,4-benzoquinol methylase